MHILEYIEGVRDRSWGWFKERADGKHAIFWLCVLAFGEAIVSPIVPETLLVAMILAGSQRWRYLAGVTALASIAGGVAGYAIGFSLFHTVGINLISFYGFENVFAEAERLMSLHAFTTMFWVSFTPVPDKVFVLAAGFLGVSFLPYILGYIFGRTLRFFLVAYLVHRYGSRVLALINRYFALLALIAVLLLAVLFAESFFGDSVRLFFS
ncbi:MAG TPA: VTT domain-containing protein [Candidatus Paceibacterota bacterium]